MNNVREQKYAIQVMSEAFKRSLTEFVGNIGDKPPIELVAWSKALIELEQEMRQELLRDVDLEPDINEFSVPLPHDPDYET